MKSAFEIQMQIYLVWIGWIWRLRPFRTGKSEAGDCKELDRLGKRDPVLNYFGRIHEMFLRCLLMAWLGGNGSHKEIDLCIELGLPDQGTVCFSNINFSG